jgi:hypothetical protein
MSSIDSFVPVAYNNQIKTISPQISSSQVEPNLVPSRKMAELPLEILQRIASSLSYKDQGRLARVAVFARDAVHDMHDVDRMAFLKAEIETLPPGPLAREDGQRLLVGLVRSRAAGHPQYWIPVMDALMGYLTTQNKADDLIQSHGYMADLLTTSGQPISSDQIYQFCRYLGLNQLSKNRPWISYRALEQYLLRPQLNFASVNLALREYLTQQAEVRICAQDQDCGVLNNRILIFQKTVIDPRIWFGFNRTNRSLWVQPIAQDGEIAPMPELLLEVLWTRIQSLRNSCMDRPFMVNMDERAEALLPRNFTLILAQRITNADIFLDCGRRTVNREDLEKPDYARFFHELSDEEVVELALAYPGALTTDES